MDCPHGSPWSDLPRAFGNWITAYSRFRDWAKAGVWKRMFDAVSDEPDMEYVMRAGPGCLNSNSASISGVSARVRLPRGTAAG
ncbi:transposase [Bradyrhizobium sp. LCT2]|nr:transposase [Bradyrhizobium sp. LCT2]